MKMQPDEIKIYFNACEACEWEDENGYDDIEELPEIEDCPMCNANTTIRSEWVQKS